MRCAARCGQIVADELGLSPREGLDQARHFLEKQAKTRVVAMGPEQARQEALALAQMRSTLGVKESK
jgi:glycerol-3-phosphate dehydrogenase